MTVCNLLTVAGGGGLELPYKTQQTTTKEEKKKNKHTKPKMSSFFATGY